MIPARIKESVSTTKVVLLIVAGVLPAVALVASPILPGWMRVWIWIPVVGLVALLVFGKMGGKPVLERLAAWARFSRRRRRRVSATHP
jgi:hypothetical protein